MQGFFSDRCWILKVCLAAACFSWLCHRAKREISEIDPPEEGVPVHARDWAGKSIHLGAKRVLEERADGYEIETLAGRATLRVPKLDGVKPGDLISALAVIEGPREFRASALLLNRGYAWKRPLNYVLSIAVLAGFLWLSRDRIGLRLREGLFRART